MKFKPSELSELMDLSYNKKKLDTGKFKIDKPLSNERVKVYTVENSDAIVVTHRGSADLRDWVDNAEWLKFNLLVNSKTYKMHLRQHMKAVNKYGADKIIVMGHSRGGLYAAQMYKDKLAKQLITYDKPVNLYDVGVSLVSKKNTDKNKTEIKTSHDVVSVGDYLLKENKHNITIPSLTWNPIHEHKTDRLKDLDDNVLVGRGIFKQSIDFSKIRKQELKNFIKQNKKQLKLDVNLTGLTKKQLVSIVQSILDNN